MKILLVAATELEIAPLLSILNPRDTVAGKLQSYSYSDHEVDVLITGVGMVATAYWLGKTLAQNKYDLLLNFGIAGSFNRELALGQVVHVVEELFSELGAESPEGFLSLREMDLKEVFPGFTLHNKSPFSNDEIDQFKKVKGITVNTVHGTDAGIENTLSKCQPDVESMEGGAFLFAALSEDISCVEIRVIYNYVEVRNKDNWNIPLAVRQLNEAGLRVIDSL